MRKLGRRNIVVEIGEINLKKKFKIKYGFLRNALF